MITEKIDGLPEGFSFERFLDLVKAHQVAATLSSRISALKPHLQKEEYESLSTWINSRVFQQLNLSKELFDILKKFDEADVKVISLKGPALSQQLYGSFAQRESIDLDLMVLPTDFFKAEEIILSFGYESTNYDLAKFSKRQLKAYQNYFCDSSYLGHKVGKGMIDIHWRMFDNAQVFPKSIDQLFEQAAPEKIAGHRMLKLSNEDLFLYLAIHASKHEWSKLKWLLDIRAFMLKYEGSVNWDVFMKYCIKHKIQRPVVMAVWLSHLYFNTGVPEIIQSELKRDKKVNALIEGAISVIEKNNHQGNRLGRSKAMLRLKPDTGLYYYYFRRIWLAPQDWMALKLPKRFFFMYFVLRPFLLLKRGFQKKRN